MVYRNWDWDYSHVEISREVGMPDSLREFFLNKLTLRITYIMGAFITSHFVALAASPKVTAILANAGILFQVQDPLKFKEYITGLMLIGGEFVYRYWHDKVILPKVQPSVVTQQTTVTHTEKLEVKPK